jgi:hypothetical protein
VRPPSSPPPGWTSGAAPVGDRRWVLTSQEYQIAMLAASGLSDEQIGSRVFGSPRTVGPTCTGCSPSSASPAGTARRPAPDRRGRLPGAAQLLHRLAAGGSTTAPPGRAGRRGEVSPYLTGELRPGDRPELRGPIGGYSVCTDAAAGGGRLDRGVLQERTSPPPQRPRVFVCGPTYFVEGVLRGGPRRAARRPGTRAVRRRAGALRGIRGPVVAPRPGGWSRPDRHGARARQLYPSRFPRSQGLAASP